ncbi:MAG: PDZ domain-containing protein [Nitrospiraceae bacterium]|nr:PDZ domain-containing protein [Nitrospiraceae bacterium]
MRSALKFAVFAVVLAAIPATAFGVSPILKDMENGFVGLHEQVSPFVVNIDTKGRVPDAATNMEGMNDLFRFFGMPNPRGHGGGMPRPRSPRAPRAQGSGFIYDKEGHIVTNNHVVENADTITVTLSNGKEYEAEVVGRDPDTDLAVIKIEAEGDLPVAPLGDSSTLKVGQFAIAVGSPRGFEGSFSFGHISALGRDSLNLPGLRFQNFIQTDAAINLGNSGGPLCNLDGEVIGISIAIVFGANSLGFAIPINTAKEIVPVLISEQKITRGYLGVGIVNVNSDYAEASGLPDQKGAFVKTVQPGTPADRANLMPYDIIRKVNGDAVESAGDLVRRISNQPPGAVVMLELWRKSEAIEVEVTLDEYAGSLQEAARGKDILGLRVRSLTPEMVEEMQIKSATKGVLVTGVEGGSEADDAGLLEGDIITEVAQENVAGSDDFYRLIREKAVPGKSLFIGYIRGGEHDITVIRIPKDADLK